MAGAWGAAPLEAMFQFTTAVMCRVLPPDGAVTFWIG